MLKVKNILLVLLTVVLLIGGSLLPVAATHIQDKATTNVVQYENIEALQLRLEEKVLSMTYPEKMFLMINGAGMEVTDENTNLKDEQVMEAAYAALTPYMDLFLGGSFDNDYIEYYPAMVYDEGDPSRYAYYWHVTMSLDMSMSDNLSVILDDETQKILAMELIDPELYIETEYLQKLQYTLASIYFADLGVEPVAEWPMEVAPYDDTVSSLAATGYVFIDEVHGAEVNVQIGVRSDGFYIYIV